MAENGVAAVIDEDWDVWEAPPEVQDEQLHPAVNDKNTAQRDREAEMRERLGKRLTYLLRYGALREGLTVQTGGYIKVKELMQVPLMRHNNEAEVIDLVTTAINYRGSARFEQKRENGNVYIRARHRQQLERSPFHEGTRVNRLLETCISKICQNLKYYDFEGFPDLYLLNSIMHKLRREKQLNNNTMRSVLAPSIEQLNLQGVYLTAASLKIVGAQCPNLRVLNLHGCGYLLNDHYMEQLLKKLQKLESLNISNCHHLTDRTLNALVKTNPGLLHLVASGNRNYTEHAVLKLVLSCSGLEHLDIYNNPNISEEGRRTLIDVGRQRKLTVVLKDLTDETVAPEDPAMVLSVWRGGLT